MSKQSDIVDPIEQPEPLLPQKSSGNHSKQVEKRLLRELAIRVSLTKRFKNGVVAAWGVTVRSTRREARKQVTHRFESEVEAREHYHWVTNGDAENPFARPRNSIDKQLAVAAQIVNFGKSVEAPPTLPLLYAIARVESDSESPGYHNTADTSLRILWDKQELPNAFDADAFESWLMESLHLLFTRRVTKTGQIESAPIAEDTAKHRRRFFVRALLTLARYQTRFKLGTTYAARVACLNEKASLALRNSKKNNQVRDAQPIPPLTRERFTKAMNDAPSLATKLYLLKTLAGALRAKEGRKVTTTKIDRMHLRINEIASKAQLRRKRLVEPYTSLAFRLIVRAEEEFQISLSRDDKSWLEKASEKGFIIRALRPTAACNLIFCNVPLDEVRHRGGWSSLKVLFEHYTTLGLSDKGGLSPAQYYNLPERLVIIGPDGERHDVGAKERNDYDRYLLMLSVQKLKEALPDSTGRIDEIVLEEAGFLEPKQGETQKLELVL